jgi:hypothetical protein
MIRVPIGDYLVTIDLHGGTDVDWSDVQPCLIKINTILKSLESGCQPIR